MGSDHNKRRILIGEKGSYQKTREDILIRQNPEMPGIDQTLLTRAETHTRRQLREPAPGTENLNCNFQIAGGSVWRTLRVKNPVIKVLHNIVRFTCRSSTRFPTKHLREIPSCVQQRRGERNHCEIPQSALFLTRPVPRGNWLPEPNLLGYQSLTDLGKGNI